MSKYCTNCGRELADGTKFCTGCGAQMADASAPATPVYNEPVQQQPAYGQPQYQQPMPQYVQPQNGTMPTGTPPQPEKKNNYILWAIIAIAVVIIGVLLYFFVFKDKGNDKSKKNNSQEINASVQMDTSDIFDIEQDDDYDDYDDDYDDYYDDYDSYDDYDDYNYYIGDYEATDEFIELAQQAFGDEAELEELYLTLYEDSFEMYYIMSGEIDGSMKTVYATMSGDCEEYQGDITLTAEEMVIDVDGKTQTQDYYDVLELQYKDTFLLDPSNGEIVFTCY